MHALDMWFFTAIYGLSGHDAFTDLLIVFVGKYVFYIVMLVFLVYLYRAFAHKSQEAHGYIIALIAALIARFGVAELIRLFVHRPRPFLALQLPHLLTDTAYSFPSGHTIFMFALATATYFFDRKLATILYISGILIGIGRIAGGVHYPSDILGGMLLGAATGAITYLAWQHFRGSASRQSVQA